MTLFPRLTVSSSWSVSLAEKVPALFCFGDSSLDIGLPGLDVSGLAWIILAFFDLSSFPSFSIWQSICFFSAI